MVRLTREESQALTRDKLLEAATRLFREDGYAATSVDRIAESAGFSKGAVYSNFASKEAIFLTVLDRHGQESLDLLLARIDAAPGARDVAELLVEWADQRSRSGVWSLTILEHARLAGPDSPSLARQREILRHHWVQLGERICQRLPDIGGNPETTGALLHEIAHAPALSFMGRPTPGDVMRLVLAPWLG